MCVFTIFIAPSAAIKQLVPIQIGLKKITIGGEAAWVDDMCVDQIKYFSVLALKAFTTLHQLPGDL